MSHSQHTRPRAGVPPRDAGRAQDSRRVQRAALGAYPHRSTDDHITEHALGGECLRGVGVVGDLLRVAGHVPALHRDRGATGDGIDEVSDNLVALRPCAVDGCGRAGLQPLEPLCSQPGFSSMTLMAPPNGQSLLPLHIDTCFTHSSTRSSVRRHSSAMPSCTTSVDAASGKLRFGGIRYGGYHHAGPLAALAAGEVAVVPFPVSNPRFPAARKRRPGRGCAGRT